MQELGLEPEILILYLVLLWLKSGRHGVFEQLQKQVGYNVITVSAQ